MIVAFCCREAVPRRKKNFVPHVQDSTSSNASSNEGVAYAGKLWEGNALPEYVRNWQSLPLAAVQEALFLVNPAKCPPPSCAISNVFPLSSGQGDLHASLHL
jgi:hypothetical protein